MSGIGPPFAIRLMIIDTDTIVKSSRTAYAAGYGDRAKHPRGGRRWPAPAVLLCRLQLVGDPGRALGEVALAGTSRMHAPLPIGTEADPRPQLTCARSGP